MTRLQGGLLAAALFACLPTVAEAQAWVVDKSRSALSFKAVASGTSFSGRFKDWDAQITFDPNNLSTGRVMATVAVASAETANDDRDELLPTPAFFDAARFPRATFVSSRFVDRGGGRYEAIGDLTVKGVTKPLTLPFTLAIDGNTAQMTGAVALNRSAFGVGTGQWAADKTIGTTVQVTIRLVATRR